MQRQDTLSTLPSAGFRAELRSDWKVIVTLIGFAILVYILLWLGWPLHSLRSIGIREITFYVNAFELRQPTDYNLLAYGQPLAPLLHALTLMISPLADEVAQTILAVSSVVMVCLIARPWGRWAAAAAAVLYLFDLPLQLLYHQVNSEGLASWFFVAILLALRYALQHPDAKRWALFGLAVGLGALARPAILGFMILAGSLVFGKLVLRRKLVLIATATIVTVAVLAPWIVYKGVRFGLWGFVRPNVDLMFNSARAYHLVDPHNGPASQKLADLLSEHILIQPEYTQYGIPLNELLYKATTPGHENDPYYPNKYLHDIINATDMYEGWNTSYRLLNQVAFEAIAAHPQEFASSYLDAAGTVLFQYDDIWIPQPQLYDIFVRGPGQQPAIYRGSISHPNTVADPSTAALEARADRIRQIFGPLPQAQGDIPLAQAAVNLWKSTWPPLALLYGLTVIGLIGNKGESLKYWLLATGATVALIAYSVLAGPLPRYRQPLESIFIIEGVLGGQYIIDIVRRLVMARRG